MIIHTTSKNRRLLFSLLLAALLVLAGTCTTASGQETTGSGSGTAQVAITGVTLDPAIFMQGDEGTLTVQIRNSGTSSVSINRADVLSPDIRVVNYQTYDKVGTLGAGNELTFTFVLKAGGTEGTFFPIFYLDFTSAGSMRYPVPVRVDTTGILVSVIKCPEVFSEGERDEITLSVSNPRDNPVNSVTIVPTGAGITASQTSLFIGTLKPDEEKQVTFGITPGQPADLVFEISYRNGPNLHQESVTVPVTFGDRRIGADLVINNVAVKSAGSGLTITGDVTNAGLKDARSVMVTVGEPARPSDPNPVWVVGTLEPDDFSSFEVSCTAQGAGTIPLIISYRDEEGRTYRETFSVSARTSVSENSPVAGTRQVPAGMNTRGPGGIFMFGSGLGQVPVIPIIVVIIAAIAGIVAWRKGYVQRIRDRFRK